MTLFNLNLIAVLFQKVTFGKVETAPILLLGSSAKLKVGIIAPRAK